MKIVKSAATAALALAIIAPAAAQSQSTKSQKNEKDYRSLQYGNGRITPQQNEGVKRRANALDEAMSDDGTTRPTPTPRPARKSGTATPQ
jgi:hypothetical protein